MLTAKGILMARHPIALLLLVFFSAIIPTGTLSAEDPPTNTEDGWTPIPFRVRDLTFPTVLVMGFMPRPNQTIEKNRWVFEFNYSASNNFQVSKGIQQYLRDRDMPDSPLTQNDVDTILQDLEGDQFLFDGEFNLFDAGVHYGLTDRLMASVRVSYLSYSGGYLDSTIYHFHDLIDIDQAGRDTVGLDHFQLFYMDGGDPFIHLQRPTSGGFTDPVFTLSYTFPTRWKGWSLGLEGGFKVPIADAEVLLSSGGFDFGLQATVQKQWQKDAVVLNLSIVSPGDFEAGKGSFYPPNLPSLNVTYARKMGRRTTGILQFFFAEHIFRDATDSALSELEFQVVIGAKFEALGGLVGVGLTENLFNFDNTPDFGVHLSYAFLAR